MRVDQLMHAGADTPIVRTHTPMRDVIYEMSSKTLGMTCVVDDNAQLVGIITDGDLRRHMGRNLLTATAAAIMTHSPKVVPPDMLASAALELINTSRITALFVVEHDKPVGIVHVHDLLRAGVA